MDSSPAIGEDGTIYVGSRDGNLYAIRGESGGLAETPWPMLGGDQRHTGRARPGGYAPYDMAGNVWEWCNDWWDYDYPSESPRNNPRGPERGIIHVNRGDGYYSRAMVNSRNATRCNGCHGLNNPASGNILGFNTGFRLVSRKTPTDLDWEGTRRRIEEAVKSGKMTHEEADAKYKEIRETLRQKEVN